MFTLTAGRWGSASLTKKSIALFTFLKTAHTRKTAFTQFQNQSGEQMSHQQAMQILDKVREGVPYPKHIIDQALRLTGDLDE